VSEVWQGARTLGGSASHIEPRTRTAPYWLAPALTVAGIGLWVLLAALTNSGQFADSIEQFVWAQSLESGYWKHPPLPSWLLWGTIKVFGFWSDWTYALAGLCFAGTALLTWDIARRLGGLKVATIAVLLQGLHLGFSQRAQLYNHNTVLLLFSALTVWAVLRAVASYRTRDWLLAGGCGALAVLSKYQAVVLLGGILLALALAGELRDRRQRSGIGWALLTATLVLLPHAAGQLWGETSPVRYAITRMEGQTLATQLDSLRGFVISQLRFHLPVALAIALAVWNGRRTRSDARPGIDPDPALRRWQRAWLIGLVAWPAAATLVVPLGSGMLLQAQWGLPAFQFLVLYLAFKLAARRSPLTHGVLTRSVLGVQLVNAAFFVAGQLAPVPADRRLDPAYPARKLAAAVLSDWQSVTACPLKFVVGPSFEAGFISIHAGGYPLVLEDGDLHKSPWIDPQAMRRDGHVVLALNTGSGALGNSTRMAVSRTELPPQLSWTVVAPELGCDPDHPPP
jgi:hypothetical protein